MAWRSPVWRPRRCSRLTACPPSPGPCSLFCHSQTCPGSLVLSAIVSSGPWAPSCPGCQVPRDHVRTPVPVSHLPIGFGGLRVGKVWSKEEASSEFSNLDYDRWTEERLQSGGKKERLLTTIYTHCQCNRDKECKKKRQANACRRQTWFGDCVGSSFKLPS